MAARARRRIHGHFRVLYREPVLVIGRIVPEIDDNRSIVVYNPPEMRFVRIGDGLVFAQNASDEARQYRYILNAVRFDFIRGRIRSQHDVDRSVDNPSGSDIRNRTTDNQTQVQIVYDKFSVISDC